MKMLILKAFFYAVKTAVLYIPSKLIARVGIQLCSVARASLCDGQGDAIASKHRIAKENDSGLRQ